MNLRIIKLIVINFIIVNYFNFALSSELILPKNKPVIEKYDIELNEINYLLPKKKPILANEGYEEKDVEIQKSEISKIADGIILPLPKPIIVKKIKPQNPKTPKPLLPINNGAFEAKFIKCGVQ